MADRPIPELEGVSHRYVDAGGLRTHVAEAGEGPPIVMLHGWPQNWWMWRELIGPIAESGRRVVCPDLRGYGWTAAPPGGYEPGVFTRDVAALIEAVAPGEPVDLVGHDWGGYTGFLLCLERPELVRRFLALNILHPFVRPSFNAFRRSWRFWYQWPLAAPAFAPALLGRMAGRIETSLAWVGGPEPLWDDRDREIFIGQFRDHDRAMGAALLYRHALIDILPATLRGRHLDRTLETETLLLFGERDRVQHPSLIPGFEANAPRMRVELVKASHFIVDSRPDLVLDRARRLFGLD